MSTRCLVVLLAGLPGLLPLAAPAAPAPSLFAATPVSGKYDAAVDLNNAGLVAVNNLDSNVAYRIGYIATSPMLESVGTLGGSDSTIRALNDNNEAVGMSTTASGAEHAFLYSGGRLRDLTTSYDIAVASSLNDRGDVAGQSTDGRAVVLRSGKAEVFGPPDSVVAAINGTGEAVGEYIPQGQGIRAFLYRAGHFSDLGTLGGAHGSPYAINDDGTVVGATFTADGRRHAFLAQGGSMTDLTPSAAASAAADVNNLGQVVGTVDGHGFLYADGELLDLNTLVEPAAGVRVTSAFAINDRGQILAHTCDIQGFCYVTARLDPVPAVPEAPTAAMLAAGLALLASMRMSRLHVSTA